MPRNSLPVLACIFCAFCNALSALDGSLEVRLGYFYPQASLMRNVYHHGGFEPQIEGAVDLNAKLKLWANFSPFWRNGSSEGLGTSTSIQLYPLSAGFKCVFPVTEYSQVYLGAGPSFSWVILHDDSPYVQQRIVKTSWGVIGKSGLIHALTDLYFLDFFLEYSYGKISPSYQQGVQSQSLNIGGFIFGMGLGVRF